MFMAYFGPTECLYAFKMAMKHFRRNDVTDSEVFFKIKFIHFLDTLILRIYILIIKINIFRGGLSDVSAETATLVTDAPPHRH